MLVVVCLAATAAAPAAAQQTPAPETAAPEDIATRDQLIANQENLLNTYRCQFNTDTHAVSSGCDNPDAVEPGTAPANPTPEDIAARDRLIADQENLLNTYRCQFDIDTHIVPGGCADTNRPDNNPAPSPPSTPTGGQFTAVSAGGSHSCGLRADQTITCWGRNDSGKSDAPDGQFTDITAGQSHSCAIRADQTITCWGSGGGVLDPPDGQFTAVTAGDDYSCAIRADQTITCWGNDSYNDGRLDAPDGQFTDITAGQSHSCAIRADQTITCWGSGGGRLDAPDGQFTAITAGRYHSCAIRADQTITCWNWTTNLPAGVTWVRSA